MPHLHSRFLGDGGANSSEAAATTAPNAVDSDFVVILAALVCALICVLGLAAVARCAWLRRFSHSVAGVHSAHHPPSNKALKKKVLRSLVKLAYADEHAGKLVDCAICLTEFAAGDEIRVLPQCGHGFHVVCIDMWLSSHSSCPLCRQVLVAAGRCQKCGGVPASSAATSAAGAGNRENDINRFLP